MNNRLQFRHHTSVFNTREEAVEYVKIQVRNSEEGLASSDKTHGYSLYAEPTVLRYRDENDPEKGPYVILAIGADTNESGQYNENKFTIIDTHKTEEELEDIHEDIEKAIKSLSIVTKDTNTLKLYSEKTDDGTIVSGDVVVAESQILNDVRKPNIILATEDGLFTYVDLEYDINTHILSFTVNGETKEMDLGIENFYVEKGYYDKKDESIHLLRNDGEEITINLENLIDEWDVEGEATDTPIVLTKEEVGYGDESGAHNHVEPWQDLLKADVRLLDSKYNILKKTSDGRFLYVDGLAKNITYFKDGDAMSVQDALDEFTVDISTDNSNIIYKKADGIFANARLKYVSKNNQLVFTTTNVSGGTSEEVIQLNTVELFKEILYDATKEELVIVYTDSNDTAQTVRVPIGEMMKDWEWDIVNDGHNVKLHKQRNVNGNDKVSADVDIFEGNNNILEDVNHQLYVRGEADNIKYGKDTNVSDELDKLNAFTSDIDSRLNETSGKVDTLREEFDAEVSRAKENEDRIESKLDAEIARSTEKDDAHDADIKRLDETIGDGFTTDDHETVTYKFNSLSAKTDSLSAKTDEIKSDLELTKANLEAEVSRAKSEESRIETKFDNALGEGFDIRNTVRDELDKEKADRKEADDKLQKEIDEVSADTASRLIDIVNKDKSINVDKTDAIRPEIKVNLSEEVEDGKANIIKLNADGLYAGVDLEYSFNEENGANQLIFKTTNGTKTFDLKTNSIVDKIYYDADTESLIVEYTVNGKRMDDVSIPVSSLISEWRIYDGHEGAVQLSKERKDTTSTDGHQDVLRADIVISSAHTDNILINDSGALYVSNKDIMKNKADIEDLNERLDAEIGRATDKEDGLQEQLDELYDEYLIEFVDTNTVNLNKVRKPKGYEIDANVKFDGANENILKPTDNGIYATVELTYKPETNTLTFVNTNKTVEIPLVSNSLIDEVYYDANQEAIVIRYTVNGTPMPNVVVPVRDLINEVDYANTSTVTLTRTVNDKNSAGAGPDIITADVNISSENEQGKYPNLIKVNSDGLYVSADLSYEYDKDGKSILRFRTSTGTTEIELKAPSIIDHIDYDPTTESLIIYYYVNGELQHEDVPLGDLIDEWTVDTKTTGAIKLTKTRDESHGKDILSAEVLITNREDNILENLNGELYVSNSAITQNATDIDALENSRLTTITTDNSMLVDGGHTSTGLTPNLGIQLSEKNNLSTNVVDLGTPFGNLIEVYEDGVYASIDVEYVSGVDKNTLVFKTTKGKKEIDLVSNADIKSLVYNKQTEELELTFGVNGDEKVITCDVNDLIEEWKVDNPVGNAVVLTKVRNDGYDTTTVGPDVLTADVKISAAPSNILQKLGEESPYGGGTLFVDGTQISANTKAIEDEATRATKAEADLKDAIDNVSDRVGTLEGNTASTYTELEGVSGRVESLESGLAQEIIDRTNADNDIKEKLEAVINSVDLPTDVNGMASAPDFGEGCILNGVKTVKAAIQSIEKAVCDETKRAEDAEKKLDDAIKAETARAIAAEEKITHALEDESKDRVSAVNTLSETLKKEEAERKEADAKLTSDLEKESEDRIAEDKSLSEKISNETIERTNADADIRLQLEKEVTRATVAEGQIQANLDTEVARAKTAEGVISQNLEIEIARSENEDTNLWNAINKEIDDRRNGDTELNEAIRNATLTFANTTSVMMEKSDKNVVTSRVQISNSDENIISVSDRPDTPGVYASVKLSYDAATNKIKLITTNGVEQDAIQLNAGSLIDDMVYDPINRALVITWKSAQGDKNTLRFPVNELFNDLVTDNPSENSAIELTKVTANVTDGSLNEGGPDRISGRVLLTNLEDNAVRIVNNGLYVSDSKMTEALEIAECVAKALTKVVQAVFGGNIDVMGTCGEGFTYIPPTGDIYNIISGCTSIECAIEVIIQKLKETNIHIEEVENNLEIVSADTKCVTDELHTIEREILGVNINHDDCGANAKYTPSSTSCIISGATNMYNADVLLDAAVCNATATLDCVEKEVKAVEKVLGGTLTGSCTNDSLEILYPISHGCLLSGATSYADADLLLEEAVCMLMKMMVGSDTASANMTVVQEGMNQWFEVNVRLSHGNSRADELAGLGGAEYLQTDEDLYITNFSGDTIEEGYTEFTDTNVLRIVDLTGEGFEFKPTAPYNGVYLSNEWNCGQYTKDGVGTPYEKYETDESVNSENYYNQRYRNFERRNR